MGRKTGLKEKKKKTRGSGCGQPQAGSALNEVLKLNLNDVICLFANRTEGFFATFVYIKNLFFT